MAKKRTTKTQPLDVAKYEILITPAHGEPTTMPMADFIREHSNRLVDSIASALSGEEVEVADDTTYTIKLVTDNETTHHGRFAVAREQPRSSESTDAAPAKGTLSRASVTAVGG